MMAFALWINAASVALNTALFAAFHNPVSLGCAVLSALVFIFCLVNV